MGLGRLVFGLMRSLTVTSLTHKLRNSVYVVLQAPDIARTAPVRAHYSTLSHAFPSISEAKVYCLGAGVPYTDQTA